MGLTFTFDPAGEGLRKVFRDYQEEALRYVWESGEGVSSRQVWLRVNDALGSKTISRASIINYLNDMVDEGVLNYVETTGKGGIRRIYSPKLDEGAFKKYVARTLIESLLRDFPDETKDVIKELHLQ